MTAVVFTLACLLAARSAVAQAWLQQAHADYLRADLDGAQRALDRADDRSTVPARFEQALIWDAGGHHAQARTIYDGLIGTAAEASVAVPSAINRVALGDYPAAERQFTDIASRGMQAADRDYARLWLLRLRARAQPGDARVRAAAMTFQPGLPYQRALVDLYRGHGDARTVLAAVDGMRFDTDLARRTTRVEAIFFVAGYQQYVLRQMQPALESYRQAWPESAGAIERPLIRQAIEELQRTQR